MVTALQRGASWALERLYLSSNRVGTDGAVAIARALERGSFPQLKRIDLFSNGIRDEGLKALAIALERATLPLLECMPLSINYMQDIDLVRRARIAVADARQRGRMLLLLTAENDRCESSTRRFLAKDGDRAVTWRIWSFMRS